jgi:hypothetical protein
VLDLLPQDELLTFDEAAHVYRLNAQPVPSVTQVLQLIDSFDGVPMDVLEAAREFGQHVHRAVELDSKGELDEDSLDPALAEYVAGWRKFISDRKAKVLASEVRVASRRLRFAGTLDSLLYIDDRHWLIDVKSGAIPTRTVGPQTAAYAHALRECWPFSFPRTLPRACVRLLPNDYRFVHLNDPRDWNVFLSALNIHTWRNTR